MVVETLGARVDIFQLFVIGLAFLIAEAMVGYVVPVLLILAGLFIMLRQFIYREKPTEEPKGS